MTAIMARRGEPAARRARDIPAFAAAGVLSIAAAGAAALGLFIARYGFFGDELYFLAAGRRLDAGYADQGPLLPAIAHLADLVAPGSLVALRIPSLVLTVAAVVVTALIAREFGGGRGAQLLAAAAYATSLLLQGHMLSTNTVDCALWTGISWLVVRWVRTRNDWLLLGAAALTAVDMQAKWLIPFFWVCLGLSVLALGPRRLLTRPLLWLGALLVVLATLPSLVWQAGHGWPQLGMGAVVAAEQQYAGGALLFVPIALLLAGLLGLPLLVYGLWRLLRAPQLREYRFLGVTTLLLFVVFAAAGGRPYYAAGIYAAVMAAGAVELTRRDMRRWARWLAVPLVGAAVVVAAGGLPYRSPSALQPADSMADAAVNLTLHGQFGWPQLAAATATAYHRLPPAQREHAVVLAGDYWSASALDQYGPRYGLPRPYSAHRGFWYFGAPPDDATTVIYTGGDRAELQGHFATVRRVGTADVRLGMPGSTKDGPIWSCSGPRQPWSVLWPRLRHLA